METDDRLGGIMKELVAREPIFHRPEFASGVEDFARTMAADYWEIGASGRRYGRDFILDLLTREPPVDAAAAGWKIYGAECRSLADATYLLTYTLDQAGRWTRRATLWQRGFSGWQILYHQGTLMASAEVDGA